MTAPPPITVARNLWQDIEIAPAEGFRPTGRVAVVGVDDVDVPPCDIVVLTGPGATPEPGMEAAHARWHEAASDVVSVGASISPADAADEPLALVRDLTRDFNDLGGGLHFAAVQSSIACRREVLEAIGGLGDADSQARLLDVAARLDAYGSVWAPEPLARCSVAATGLEGAVARAAAEGRTLEAAFPGLSARVPWPPFRDPGSPRRHPRPAFAVNVAADEAHPEQACATIEGILGSRMGDLELRVQARDGHPQRAEIEAAFESDPRATFGPHSADGFCDAPFQATVPAVARMDPRTLGDLHELALGEGAGALHVTVPGEPPQDAMIELVASGALGRATRLAAVTGDRVEGVIGRLFGERWVSGVEVSVRRHGVDEPQITEHGPLAAATDLAHERNAHLRFRDRADELAERSALYARRTISERLRARAERQRAERLEARLAERRRAAGRGGR